MSNFQIIISELRKGCGLKESCGSPICEDGCLCEECQIKLDQTLLCEKIANELLSQNKIGNYEDALPRIIAKTERTGSDSVIDGIHLNSGEKVSEEDMKNIKSEKSPLMLLSDEKIFWNGTVLGKEINRTIQDLCQEYWESGFSMGSSMEREKHGTFIYKLKSRVSNNFPKRYSNAEFFQLLAELDQQVSSAESEVTNGN